VESISRNPNWADRIAEHKKKHPADPLPIPFNDPDPQVMIPYSQTYPWHIQIHRDAFQYGDVGLKADPRVVVDLRFFGKSDISAENRVTFGESQAGITDIYGMPQPTVRRHPLTLWDDC
jgi:pyranose oxidase